MEDDQKPGEESRTKRGQFAPGVSGNPRGRPPGSRNSRTVFLHSLLDDDAEAIVAALVESAKKGKPAALRLATERLLPARASRDRSAEIAGIHACDNAQDIAAACADLIERTLRGDLTIETCNGLLRLLELQRRTLETADLAKRLEELEASGNEEAARELEKLERRNRGQEEENED